MPNPPQPPVKWPNLDPKKVHPDVALAIRLLYNALENHQQAFTALQQKAQLVATVSAGVVTRVDVVVAGTYAKIPTVTAVGGGGSGVKFHVSLNQNGGIASVKIVAGGTGYTSAPALVVT